MSETNVIEMPKEIDPARAFFKTDPETGEEIAGELHEFFGADSTSYNIDLDEGDEQDGSGRPGIAVAANAIQFFVGNRDEDPTVAEVAEVFKMPPEAVVQAVEWHPWMVLLGDLSGPIGELVIAQDGE